MKKHLGFVLLVMFFITGNLSAQSKNGYVTMVVTKAANASGAKSNIIITHGTGNTERVDLNNIKMGFLNWAEDAELITDQMNKLKEQGYKIITSNSHSAQQGAVLITTYIFGKD